MCSPSTASIVTCAPIATAGVKAVYGRDPFGNVIELQQIVAEGTMPRLPSLA